MMVWRSEASSGSLLQYLLIPAMTSKKEHRDPTLRFLVLSIEAIVQHTAHIDHIDHVYFYTKSLYISFQAH